jgi:hypothetical protein
MDALNEITPTHDALHDKSLLSNAAKRSAMLADYDPKVAKATAALISLKDNVKKGDVRVSCGKDVTKTIKKAKLTIGVNYATKKLNHIDAAETPKDKKDIAKLAMAKIAEKGIQLPEFLHRYLNNALGALGWG